MLQVMRLVGILALASSLLLQIALRWSRPAAAEPYLIYVAYLDHDNTVTLRMVATDGSSVPQDLIVPRRDWQFFSRFTITHDRRFLLFNVLDPSGTHARSIDLAGRPVLRWGSVGIEENFYSLMPDASQALVAVADSAYQTFYLYQAEIGGQSARRISDYKVSLRGKLPQWSGDWIVFQHITERGLGVAALNTQTGANTDLSSQIPVAYLEQVVDGWVYFVGYGADLDGTIFKARLDGGEQHVIGHSATSFSTPLQVVDGTLLYAPPEDGIHPPAIWAAHDGTTYPLIDDLETAAWFNSSVDGWVLLDVQAADGTQGMVRVRPDASELETLPMSMCVERIGQAWSTDGQTHFMACYRDHHYWLEARALPSGAFIGQGYIDLPVQPEIIASPSNDWVLLRVVNEQGGIDYYRASADLQSVVQLTNDPSQKDFAAWYTLPTHQGGWIALGLAALMGVGGFIGGRLRPKDALSA